MSTDTTQQTSQPLDESEDSQRKPPPPKHQAAMIDRAIDAVLERTEKTAQAIVSTAKKLTKSESPGTTPDSNPSTPQQQDHR